MAEQKRPIKNRGVDEAGIRLAPTPMHNVGYHVMPTVMQEFVLEPHIEVQDPEGSNIGARKSATTENDFQPKKQDMSKKWKRTRHSKNAILGVLMLLTTLAVVMPYILGAAGVWIDDALFRYVPKEFGALYRIVLAFSSSIEVGWAPEAIVAIWLPAVPSMVLVVGIIALAVNLLKAIVALFGTVKPMKYTPGAFIYLAAVAAVVIASLVGVPVLGIEKVEFLKDIIYGYSSSELFSLAVFAIGNFAVSFVCTAVGSDKYGYLR